MEQQEIVKKGKTQEGFVGGSVAPQGQNKDKHSLLGF
jgi:hypothetical protein